MAKSILVWTSVVVQAAAAALWFWSARTSVTTAEIERAVREVEGNDAWLPGGESVDGVALGPTVMLAAKWNRWAALATGVGVALQAIATVLPACAS